MVNCGQRDAPPTGMIMNIPQRMQFNSDGGAAYSSQAQSVEIRKLIHLRTLLVSGDLVSLS